MLDLGLRGAEVTALRLQDIDRDHHRLNVPATKTGRSPRSLSPVKAAKADPFIEAITVTGICTALRRGDRCRLLKTAVDLPNRFMSVKSSKTGELVQIPIFPLLYEILSKQEPNDDSPNAFPEQPAKY